MCKCLNAANRKSVRTVIGIRIGTRCVEVQTRRIRTADLARPVVPVRTTVVAGAVGPIPVPGGGQ